ncbi:hypothetical protein HRI_001439200 [Hibiscus trionum]|uniref:Endonuclease/exonuclease/phosphatase domain-containing protein n=1 Tax=Hibiscus trionum TaxID=183268 RepID=A0A9W7HHR2_HIBTR|nr:hypothetical protein HRI_001439200 [Hibiscus trionum]
MDLSIISWNIRGIRRLEKKKAIRDLCRRSKILMAFLQETKVECFERSDLRKIWANENAEMVLSSASGSAGGLLTFWGQKLL